MFKSKLFFRYFLIAATFSIGFLLLILLAAQSINKDSFTDLPGQGQMRRLVQSLTMVSPDERVTFLEENTFSQNGMRPFEIFLCEEKGNIIFPENHSKEIINLSKESGASLFSFIFGNENIKQIELLPNEPKQYLIFSIELSSNHPQIVNKKQKFITLLGILTLAMTIGVFSGLFLIFSLLRSRAKHLDYVMEELHQGNLKARLPLGKMDEIGLMMSRFNLMADKIENLVNNLRKTESTRKELLRELAHDLRTPIASLKNLLEILHERKHLLSEDKKDELLITSLNEIEYFSTLVDDLLFLGQIQEPKYRNQSELVSFTEVVQDEINQMRPRFSSINVDLSFQPEQIMMPADKKLMHRLFRNLLENSFSFAKSSISVKLHFSQKNLQIVVTDDGPGFSEEGLISFGQKKSKRVITENKNRISIGLGSVIMKSIVEAYNGSIIPRNLLNGKNEKAGAEINVLITFGE